VTLGTPPLDTASPDNPSPDSTSPDTSLPRTSPPALAPILGAVFPRTAFGPDETAALVALQQVLDTDVEPRAASVDREGRYPTTSIAALKRSGILKSAVPAAYGGLGASNRFSAEAQTRIAAADSAVAQVFKIHDELVREIFVYCPEDFAPKLAKLILDEDAIIGLAVAENGRSVDAPMQTTVFDQPDGSSVVNGVKIYTTGAAEADYIAVWAFDPIAGASDWRLGLKLNLVPRSSPGVTVHRDWDMLGQRGTDSGTITFDQVACDPGLVANVPGRSPVLHGPLRYQVGFAADLVGIGVAALRAAIPFVHEVSRPWPSAAVSTAADDVVVRRLAGELAAELAAAYALVIATGDLLDACDRGEITRTELAIPVYAARVAANKAALHATSEIFQLMGTRSAKRENGFDRFWRNARTLSLHDPVDWKHVEIGSNLLSGWEPPFSPYT